MNRVVDRGEKEESLSLLNLAQYRANVYVGLSGPYSTKEKMVEAALLSCAKSILLENALALDNTLVMQINSREGLVSFAQKEHAYYDDKSLAKVINELEILSITFDKSAGAIVIAAYDEKKATKRPYAPVFDKEGKPTWIYQYPRVDGYRFGVGSSKAYYFFNDSLEASDFSAAQNILDLYSDHTYSVSIDTTRSGVVNEMENSIYQSQMGLLKGFTIIDRYYDDSDNTYWSLASITE